MTLPSIFTAQPTLSIIEFAAHPSIHKKGQIYFTCCLKSWSAALEQCQERLGMIPAAKLRAIGLYFNHDASRWLEALAHLQKRDDERSSVLQNPILLGRIVVECSAEFPGQLLTELNAKIVYNIRLTNNGAHRIGWAIKTTNMKRPVVDPPAGCLDSKEGQMLTIACEPFDFVSEETNNDRISVEWTNAPEGVAKQFCLEWFLGDGLVRRKNLPIEYNP